MLEKIKSLPKIELHFHLDGSVPISIIKELSGKTEEEITKEMVAPDNCRIRCCKRIKGRKEP